MRSRTQNGKPVHDFFSWYDTLGVPLEVIFELAKQESMVLDFHRFWAQILEKNWNPRSIYTRLCDAVRDAFGEEYYQEWLPRMKLSIMSHNVLKK